MNQYLYVGHRSDVAGVFSNDALQQTTERHKLSIDRPALTPAGDLDQRIADPALAGVVFEVAVGYPDRRQLARAARVMRVAKGAWFYWPAEQAVERLDADRLRSFRRLWAAAKGFAITAFVYRRLRRRPGPALADARNVAEAAVERLSEARSLLARASPGASAALKPAQRGGIRGAYLRTDYWAKLTSGGSYGHTCYVAAELSRRCDRFIAFTGSRFDLVDRLGVEQIVLTPPGAHHAERDLLLSTPHYAAVLRPAFQALAPAFVYERLCLGNFAGAAVCQELGIPYVVEYNGSELSMRRSFEGGRYVNEDVYLAAEQVAFEQAALITVVSEAVREDLVGRGVPPERILVNPNGADVEAYAPADEPTRAAIRAELGWDDSHSVIGFIGTFGGWHGIDVLAASLAPICGKSPRARFLIIGDGPHRPLLEAAIRDGRLSDRVRCVGRVPQAEGARLLKACNVYVSPHSSHMVDGRFFGSPTKLFEYMALGGGIVASDLEQLGAVLSPALRPEAFASGTVRVSDERAVLCAPGDVDQFVAGVTALLHNPSVAQALGRNARRAVLEEFSWSRHVQRIWDCLTGATTPGAASFGEKRQRQTVGVAGHARVPIVTGDAYKDQVQFQWDNNPVGSQYVKHAEKHTLDWFLEVEAHRYGEYAPWMPRVMEFDRHRGQKVLEVGAGMGTDLAQFARHGAIVTDVDLSAGHLEHARENFRLRGLQGRFVHHDAESLPFEDGEFDLVYSNGVIHHSPNTNRMVEEIYRVLRPGGRAIVMVYAENSLHHWKTLVGNLGLRQGMLDRWSIGEIMSRHVELSANDARPLVKVYTARRLRELFRRFEEIAILKRQLTAPELAGPLRWIPLGVAGRLVGWNLIVKARKPSRI
jgi:glycosyltransferase involved in cell wall biosynthesis/ubiquinone/menaquinone biosynthesis C-methylase UbiE